MPNVVAIGQAVAEILRFFNFVPRWQPSAILNLCCASLDHPQRAFGGLYHCAKFGWSQYSNILRLRLQNSRPNIVVLGRCDPLNGKQSLRNPQKVGLLPCAKTGRMTYRSSKSIHRCRLGAIPGTKLKKKKSIQRNRNTQQVTCSPRPPTLLHAPCGFGSCCREGKSVAE